jgi:hypothetical protein
MFAAAEQYIEIHTHIHIVPQKTEISSIYWAQLSVFHLKAETEWPKHLAIKTDKERLCNNNKT